MNNQNECVDCGHIECSYSQDQCSIRFPWDTQMELTLGEKCYAYSMDGYDIYYLVLQIVTHYYCAIINYQ